MGIEKVLGLIILLLVIGSLGLAIIDPTTRVAFVDLTKVAVGACMGLLIPSDGVVSSVRTRSRTRKTPKAS